MTVVHHRDFLALLPEAAPRQRQDEQYSTGALESLESGGFLGQESMKAGWRG